MTDAARPIPEAVRILRAGGLVAFPTETVYGLGADATSAAAVARIFAAKGRPPTNPLIVHVADAVVARQYAGAWPPAASRLAERFWPGPLTLVLPKSPQIVPAASAGLGTVGLRVPDHPLALEMLRAFGGPVAAPSANKSNHVSPTTADHVRQELSDAVDLVLDGGPCSVGIESTVVDLTGPRPAILRPGGVSRGEVEAVVGPVDVFGGAIDAARPAPSPGQHAKHYAPRTRAVRFGPAQRVQVRANLNEQSKSGVMLIGSTDDLTRSGPIVTMPGVPEVYAHHFYAVLRELDAMSLHTIFVEAPPHGPEWEAVRDRIIRATQPFRMTPTSGA
jgi:L-threonylcarbamoyladenylate synthase